MVERKLVLWVVGMRVAENLVLLYTELGVLGGLSELVFLLERSEAL